ncbi:unnamed protein product [Dicrocoelium dendriticum]|nr:unnamed protein product [Dicrocoelium dendriticum]
MLVLNIQWRGRAYMGTLLDASKQSFGQSCPDKGIISALSLLNGRRAWPHGSPGRFRTRGLHHFHHHHHHHHTARHRHLPPGASMTTRSAAAAAAASIEPAESIRSVEPELELVENHDDDCQPNLSVYDLEVLPGPESYSSNGPQRGTKRKRRRGAGVGRPCRRVATKLNAESTALVSVSPERNVNDQSPHLEQATRTDTCAPDSSTTPIPFSCPYPGCKMEFPDLLSMRYHFSMGHITRDQALDDSPPPNPSQPERNLVTVVTESEQNSETVVCTVEPNCTLIRHPPPIQSSPPPTLGRAHGVIKEPTDEHGLCMASLDDRFDDNLAPPRLHRIVSITDSVNEFSERRTASSPSKQTRSPSPNDEPPAPSPAYSDISDDGTVPAELQDSSFTGDSPSRQLSSVSQSKLFTPGHTLLSPLAGSLVSRRATAFEFKASPSIASPVLTHSPTMRHGVQNGFYFPVSILPHVVSAPHSPSAVVSNSNSVMSGLSIVTNSIDLRPSDHLPGRGLSPSLPLSTYAPITQATYLLPTPPPTICTSHFIPAPHTVCIPGVNSFSTPPPTLTAVATHRPTIATAVTNVSTTTLYSISSSVSTSNRHHIGTPETDHTTDSAVLSRSKPPDTGVYQTSHYPHHRHHQMRRGSGSIRRPHHSDLQHSSTLGLSSLDFRSDPSHIRTQVGVSSTRCAGSVDR